MNQLKISIITPSYNQGHFIGETIQSIMDQNYQNIEYLIIDGGSTDNTIDVIKEYESKYPGKINWVSEKDRGQTHAINKGFAKATGDVICWLNSDDYFAKGIISEVMDIFNNQEDVKWISGDYRIIDADGNPIQSFVMSYKKLLRILPKKFALSIVNYINQPSTFWRKSVIEEIGELKEELKYTMDYDFWLRIIHKYPPYILQRIVSYFRIHGDSKGGALYKNQFQEEIETAKENGVTGLALLLHKIHNKAIIAAYNILK